MKKEKDEISIRTSLSLPKKFLEALEVVKEHEEVLKSSQIKIGLMLYFERHRELLISRGIDLWKDRI